MLATDLRVKLDIKRSLNSAIANIHLNFDGDVNEPLSFTYGSCDSNSSVEAHHNVAVLPKPHQKQDRLIWRIPDDVPPAGCLSAWNNEDELLGRSEPQVFHPKRRNVKRSTSIKMDNSSGIDAEGPWFDGVAKLKNSNMSAVDTEAAKSKSIAIVGAGMAGLMTWLSLNMVGMKNISIIEASQRLGGRVHTTYFGDPSERQYQDEFISRPRNLSQLVLTLPHRWDPCASHN